MQEATPSQTSDSPGPAPAIKITRGHSCVLCQQRKVKCDRQKPCSNCVKTRVECVASTPSLPRRKRRKVGGIDDAARLRKATHLLKTHNIKFDDDDILQEADEGPAESTPDHSDFKLLSLNTPRAKNIERGALYSDNGNSHYIENPLWEGINKDDFQYPKDALQGSSDDDANDGPLYPSAENLLMGNAAGSKIITSLHPSPVHIFQLWQTFLGNVNPLVKIFHAPTVQQTILDACGNLQNISRPTEALMFSIYFLAITSLNNADCQNLFGESRQALVAKYCHATQQALMNAKFLRSMNLLTLDALTIYILGVRRIYDPHSIWVLTGVAVRIAQRLGLHRDGSKYKISPFDAEMRRRTWWQIIFLDGHASKLAGAGFPAWHTQFDAKVPLNISDSDLSPAMKDPPTEKEGATEMIFCSLRYDVAEAIRNTGKTMRNNETEWDAAKGPQHLQEKDRAIDDLEAQFQQKYGRYCDTSIPLHLLVLHVIKSVICTMRIMAHHPRQYLDKGVSMPQSEKDYLFVECLQELEIDGLGHTVKAVEGFRWHIQDHFQMDCFIIVLSELRHRIVGDLVERAWQQVAIAYEYRPEMITDSKNALYFAVGNLTLKAWRKREESGILNQGPYEMSTPQYITMLHAQRNQAEPQQQPARFPSQESYVRSNRMPEYSNDPASRNNAYQNVTDQWPTTNTFNMSMPDITPKDWEYWRTLMDGDLPAYTGNDNEMGYNW
ncbi:Aurofusarin cluster transcription factor aurR2 [Lachnellula suecica]|uniref:Aurofusarin cluster transcription factor aurR2 n=1 Tax=Lachnellula suecica TaxID=602035 RepID=A0A8T9CG77_9HELO|nr:Aurofusarin cluster transcription factor aurR2 [Lachnellula suecica]